MAAAPLLYTSAPAAPLPPRLPAAASGARPCRLRRGSGEEVGGGTELAAEGEGSRRRRGKGTDEGRPAAARSIHPAAGVGWREAASRPLRPRGAAVGEWLLGARRSVQSVAGAGLPAAGSGAPVKARFCPLRLFLFPSRGLGPARSVWRDSLVFTQDEGVTVAFLTEAPGHVIGSVGIL